MDISKRFIIGIWILLAVLAVVSVVGIHYRLNAVYKPSAAESCVSDGFASGWNGTLSELETECLEGAE